MITERQQYAMLLKKAIEVGVQLKTAMENLNMDATSVKNDLKILKDKLDKFDVYEQKTPYDYRCATCGEVDCVCSEIEPELPKAKTEDEEFMEKVDKLL